ncbi:gastrula zinc finger protein XlCGF48.2-like [Achroia grisella]|uniref:gastrula zinc finger protein XlCGF48.2-like n=1 Tax=Achroia grisella TaxID=688607 RepID=UPI0027D2E742|nr:gastrula zinc finger protein XlCGF48.2-like [Achroia grisella]
MEAVCRGCLAQYSDSAELVQYTEKNRRLFVYSTGLQVKRNDSFIFQLCKDCYINMKQSCKFKKQCRSSDKKFQYYLLSKDADDTVDMASFLRNHDENMMLRFPLMSGNNTPANHRKDDDNASTCTSIGNFMTDILQGEEMPDTEARIIKQVIEEEADVLDDSLDSHWLQDDISIDPDFAIDFSFSPFSTPHSVNRDHCYTPKRLSDLPSHKYVPSISKKILNSNKVTNNHENNINKTVTLENNGTKQTNGNQEFDTKLENNFYSVNMQSDDEMENIYSKNAKQSSQTKNNVDINFDSNYDDENDFDDFDHVQNNVPMIDALLEPPENINCDIEIEHVGLNINIDDTIGHGKKYYMPNDMINYENNIAINHGLLEENISQHNKIGKAQCTIDRNLEKALKNIGKTEISLEDLLASPTVFPGSYAPSTPTIDNIIFNAKKQLYDDSNDYVHKAGKCIEKFQNIDGDISLLDDFFNKATDEYDFQNRIDSKVTEVNKSFLNNVNIKKAKKKNIDNESQYNLDDCYCKLCKKQYVNISGLKIHFAKFHQNKIPRKKAIKPMFKKACDYCSKEYRSYKNFLNHLKSHMEPREEFRCDVCKLPFPSEAILRVHRARHKGSYLTEPKFEKEYCCTICGVKLSTNSNYRVHMRRHNKKYVASCDECKKGFVTKSEYTIHMRKHTGEQPFKCTYCSLSFNRRTTLIAHVKFHLGEKSFECDHCHRKFVKKESMVTHIKNLRCIKRFLRLQEMKKSSKKGYFECLLCQKIYVKRKNFINHIKNKKCLSIKTETEEMEEPIKTEIEETE